MKSISSIKDIIYRAGKAAAEQRQMSMKFLDREFKPDGSVVTETDRYVEDFLCTEIDKVFPGCNYITEEKDRAIDKGKDYYFVIDPIDGTDSFSQGIHYWSISVGLLDMDFNPVAGIVYAPRLDLFFFADISIQATLNNAVIPWSKQVTEITPRNAILTSSKMHKQMDFDRFPGKIRAMGSAALHLCSVCVYPETIGAIQGKRACAWDIAAAHAICRSTGVEFEYFHGSEVSYKAMEDNDWHLLDYVAAGKKGAVRLLRDCIKKV